MAGEAAIGISVYSALEASEARRAAEQAEARTFMETYSHRAATPEDRQRYVEVVRSMYPVKQGDSNSNDMPPVAVKCIGGCIVLAFLIPAIGAAYGWLRLGGDVEEGLYRACAVMFWAFWVLFGLGILGGGVAMLLS